MKAAQERAGKRRQAVSGAMNLLNPAADRQFAILDGLAPDQVHGDDLQLAIEGATQRLALVRDLLDLARLSVAGSETANGQLTAMLIAGINLSTGEVFDANEPRRQAWAKKVASGVAGVVSEKGVRLFVRAAERLAIRNGHSIARAVEGALSQLVTITQPMSSFLFWHG